MKERLRKLNLGGEDDDPSPVSTGRSRTSTSRKPSASTSTVPKKRGRPKKTTDADDSFDFEAPVPGPSSVKFVEIPRAAAVGAPPWTAGWDPYAVDLPPVVRARALQAARTLPLPNTHAPSQALSSSAAMLPQSEFQFWYLGK